MTEERIVEETGNEMAEEVLSHTELVTTFVQEVVTSVLDYQRNNYVFCKNTLPEPLEVILDLGSNEGTDELDDSYVIYLFSFILALRDKRNIHGFGFTMGNIYLTEEMVERLTETFRQFFSIGITITVYPDSNRYTVNASDFYSTLPKLRRV